MPTPHNNAAKGDFAKTVLMPGDPLRAKFIAETFLTEPKLVNNVRGVQGYTGTYKGVPVSVMASGMGIPSIGIYSYELYTQYDVENIIRVGSAGAMRADLELGSVVAGQGACTNSAYLEQYELGGTFAPIADFDLLMAAVESAKELGAKMPVGNLYSSDTFYDAAGRNARFGKMGIMAVEMEAAGLYCTAAYTGKRALAICSISDNLVTGEELSAAGAELVRVIRESGLPNRTTSMFTEIEGDWDEVMQVVRDATFVLASKGIRTEVVLKADIRPGFTDTMTGKLERMEAQIKKQEEAR